MMTGNTIVIKTSPFTPLTTNMWGELVAGIIPAGVVNILSGGNDAGGKRPTICFESCNSVPIFRSLTTITQIVGVCSMAHGASRCGKDQLHWKYPHGEDHPSRSGLNSEAGDARARR